MKGKWKALVKGAVLDAALPALAGAALSLLLCTMLLGESLFYKFVPLWLFAGFAALYFILDSVPGKDSALYEKLPKKLRPDADAKKEGSRTSARGWLMGLILAGAALTAVLLLILL